MYHWLTAKVTKSKKQKLREIVLECSTLAEKLFVQSTFLLLFFL